MLWKMVKELQDAKISAYEGSSDFSVSACFHVKEKKESHLQESVQYD